MLLASCGGQAPAETPTLHSYTAEEAAQALLTTDAFSEQLELVDSDIAAALYGLDESAILDCAAYLSTGATAEECTFLITETEDAALEVLQRFQIRIEDQILAVENYQPAEVAKLEEVIYGCFDLSDGVMVYLVVAEDAAAAQEAMDSLIA